MSISIPLSIKPVDVITIWGNGVLKITCKVIDDVLLVSNTKNLFTKKRMSAYLFFLILRDEI